MTIATSQRSQSYVGTGLVSSYAIPFKFFDNDTISVTIDNVLQTQGSAYIITGDGPPITGVVELTDPLGSNAVLLVKRTIPYTQLTDLQGQGNFQPETYENALDTIVMMMNQLAEDVASALAIVTAIEDYRMIYTPTFMQETEILLNASTPTSIPTTPLVGRVSAEIQNNGPNDIWVGPLSNQRMRKIIPKESWTVDYYGPLYGITVTATQVTGAGTVLTEVK